MQFGRMGVGRMIGSRVVRLMEGLRDVTPVYEYEPNTWGPAEANRIITGDGGWHNPKHKEAIG